MANSFIQYVATGNTDTFSITFGYLDASHIEVRVDAIEVPFTLPSESQVQISGGNPSASSVVEIRRVTPKTERQVIWQNASNLTAEDLNTSDLQTLYITQEAFDEVASAMNIDATGVFDARTKKIGNVVNPTEPTDVATKAYVDSFSTGIESTIQTAVDAAEDATQSATDADTSAQEAANSASEAASSSTDAAGFADDALLSRNTARDARDLAQRWANDPEDSEVAPGLYSAKHWALRASEITGGTAESTVYDNSLSGLEGDTVQEALDELTVNLEGLDGFCNGIYYYPAGQTGTFLPKPTSNFIEYEIYAGSGGSHDGASASGTAGGASSITGVATASGGDAGTNSTGTRATDGTGTDGDVNGLGTLGGDTQEGQHGGRGGFAKGRHTLTVSDKTDGIAFNVGDAGQPDGQGGYIVIREFGLQPTPPFPVDPRVTSFYDSLGNYFKSNASGSGGWNDQLENYFSTSGGVQDMATDGLLLLRSSAEAVGGGNATRYLIDDSAGADPADWVRGSQFYVGIRDALTTPADSSDALIVHGGTNDANPSSGITKSKYKQALAKFKEFIQEDFTECRFIVLNILHRSTASSASDANYQAIREAQLETIEADDFFKRGIDFYDLDLRDAVHPTDAVFSGEMARRQAKNLAYHAGLISSSGVFGAKVTQTNWNGIEATLTIEHDAGTDLTVPSGAEGVFSIVSDGIKVLPASITKNSPTELVVDFAGTGLANGEDMAFYIGYGAMKDLAQTSASVILDNATDPLPLQTGSFVITNDNPISDISNLAYNLDASLSTKTYSGSEVTEITDLNSNTWDSTTDRYPEFSSGFLTAPDNTTHLRAVTPFTPDAVNGTAFGGVVFDMPASMDNAAILAFGSNNAGSTRAALRTTSGGNILWSRNDLDGFETISSDDHSGSKVIILWNFRSLTEVDFYVNSLTPVTFDPFDNMTAHNRAFLFAQTTAFQSVADTGIGYFFHKGEALDIINDPSINDIMEYLNTRFNVGLTL